MTTSDTQVAVIGGGVVGCAVAHALARRGVEAVVLEAERGLALGASGANSGILHTGFDSAPGELETRLLLRSAELRTELLDELAVPVRRCGARLAASNEDELQAISLLAENARANGVEAHLDPDGSLTVPGEAVTDPVAFVHALASGAQRGGATVRLGAAVGRIRAATRGALTVELAGGERLRARAAVNCAGLFADEVARMAGDDFFSIYPRKGEFIVFAPPAGEGLQRILLPVPSPIGKGVLVFPTIDGYVVAGPTAREREDKCDWSVEGDAEALILDRARRMYPALERSRQVDAYAGLRPAGRAVNYLIEFSRALPQLLHVAAIRSTGLSASLGIGEHVVGLLADRALVAPVRARRLPSRDRPSPTAGWWQRAARHHAPHAERGTA
jgi:glycerol-3-phosphate dehydrogenase